MRPSPLFINLLRLLPVILFCLFGTAAAEPLATAEPLDVIAAIPRNSPPEYQLDTAGHPGGFAIELMALIAQRAGLNVTYRVEDNWDEAIRSLREGRADLIPNLAVGISTAADGRWRSSQNQNRKRNRRRTRSC